MTAADRPSVTDNARAERPLRCDGTPHPEGAIPPLSEHDYRWDGDDPYVVCARCGERRDALTASRVLDYHRRAETTTEEWPRCKASRDGGCARCHDEHGRHVHCRAETTTEATERIARQIAASTAMTGTDARQYVEAIQAIQRAETTTATTATTEDAVERVFQTTHPAPNTVMGWIRAGYEAGLFATARTRPHRDDLARAIASGYETDDPAPNRHDYRAADAVLALLEGGDDQ